MLDLKYRLILASQSPRRRELLCEAGYEFEVIVPDEDAETPAREGEPPSELVTRLAGEKTFNVVERLQAKYRDSGRPNEMLVLGCDTVAECDGIILGKLADENDARAMLTMLSGREHHVFSGLCLWAISHTKPFACCVDTTRLRMDRLSPKQLDEYLASGAWRGKAGAFGYQDRLGWVHIVEGSESNVVGLPMELLGRVLTELD